MTVKELKQILNDYDDELEVGSSIYNLVEGVIYVAGPKLKVTFNDNIVWIDGIVEHSESVMEVDDEDL